MINRIINSIRYRLGLESKIASPYPYNYFQKEANVNFEINNSIEEFRLKDWGGEKGYVQEMVRKLNSNDTFLDIGASVGLISVIAAKKLDAGQVISIEPDPENKRCLEKNYKINNLKNFRIVQIAAGDKKDTLTLYTAGSNGFSPSLQKVNGIDTTIEVNLDSIDNLIKENLIPSPNVVKIDIEGAEFMALKGMAILLKSQNKPRLIFVELHPLFLPSFGSSVDEILAYMQQYDYSLVERIDRDAQVLCEFKANS